MPLEDDPFSSVSVAPDAPVNGVPAAPAPTPEPTPAAVTPQSAPAIAPEPPLIWNSIAARPAFQSLSGEEQKNVFDAYTKTSRDYLASQPGADPATVDKSISDFSDSVINDPQNRIPGNRLPPGFNEEIKAAPTFGQKVTAPNIQGPLGNLTNMAWEGVRRALSPMFGPTETQKIEQSIPVRHEDGTTTFEYKPAGSMIDKEGFVPALNEFVMTTGNPANLPRAAALLARGESVTPESLAAWKQKERDAVGLGANPNDSKLKATGKALTNVTLNLFETLANPAVLAVPESKILSGAFSAQMLSSVSDGVTQMQTAKTTQEKIEGGLTAAVGLGLGSLAGAHAFHGEVTPAVVAEHIDKVPDQLLQIAAADPGFYQHSDSALLTAIDKEMIRRGLKPQAAENFIAGERPPVEPSNELVTPEDGKPQPLGLKPAYKTDKQTYVSSGPTHFEAVEEAHSVEGEPNGEYGFVTPKGEFLDRKQAHARVQEAKASGELKQSSEPQEDHAPIRVTNTTDANGNVSNKLEVDASVPIAQLKALSDHLDSDSAISDSSKAQLHKAITDEIAQRAEDAAKTESEQPPLTDIEVAGLKDAGWSDEQIQNTPRENLDAALYDSNEVTAPPVRNLLQEQPQGGDTHANARKSENQPEASADSEAPEKQREITESGGGVNTAPAASAKVTDAVSRATKSGDLEGELNKVGTIQQVFWDKSAHDPQFVSQAPGSFNDTQTALIVTIGDKHFVVPSGVTSETTSKSFFPHTDVASPDILLHKHELRSFEPPEVIQSGDGWKVVKPGRAAYGATELPSGRDEPVEPAGPSPAIDTNVENAPAEQAPPPISAPEKAWVKSTFEGVNEALTSAGKADPNWTPDAAERVSATINKYYADHGNGREEYLDAARDAVQADLLRNVAETGSPLKVRQENGKIANYNPFIVARREIENLRKKASTQNETTDEAAQEAATTKSAGATATDAEHQKLAEAVDQTRQIADTTFKDFANSVKVEGATPDQVEQAARELLDETVGNENGGFAEKKTGRPSEAVKKLKADPGFQDKVRNEVFGKIASAVKALYDESVLDGTHLSATHGAFTNATSGIVNFMSLPPGQLGRVARGWWSAAAGRTMPRFTAADRELGEKGAQYISAHIAAKPLADLFVSRVIDPTGVDPKRFAAALSEDNLRSVRQQNLDKAAEAQKNGKPDKAQEYLDRASNTFSMIGVDKPFKDETEYQAYLAQVDVQQAVDLHRMLWDQEIDPIYRAAMKIDPNEVLPERGMQTGARVNLMSLKDGDKGVAKVTGAGAGNLRNTLQKKSPFGIEAKGTGNNYETDYATIIGNTYGRQLSIARHNAFIKDMVDKGHAIIAKPGETVTMPDGEATVSFPLKQKTIVRTADGDTQVLPKNEDLYVRESLSGEYRNAINVDAHPKMEALGRVIQGVNSAALYGLTDVTVHLSNLATSLMTRPAITGSTAGDTALSALARADVPVTIFKAVKKSMQNNQEQFAELAAIGATRAETHTAPRGLGWSSKIIHWADKTTRLMLDDAFENLVSEGKVEDTATNRREFVNQVGQYNRRTSSGINRIAKDAGIAPFITAGTTFNRLALRTALLQSGAKHTSGLNAAATAVNVAAKWVGAAVFIASANYLLTHNKGGGLLGRPGVPLGNIDTGTNDEQNKPRSVPAADLLGLGRAGRITGVRGYLQAKRNGLTDADAQAAGMRDVSNTVSTPLLGPVVRLGSGAIFGREPFIGAPRKYPIVPPGQNQVASDIKHAVADVNPVSGTVTDALTNPRMHPSDLVNRQLPRFTLRPSNSAEMMGRYPEIVHKAQLSSFVDDTIYTARRMNPQDRRKYVEDQMSQIPPHDRMHLREQLRIRRVQW